jgi:hypothetical protein
VSDLETQLQTEHPLWLPAPAELGLELTDRRTYLVKHCGPYLVELLPMIFNVRLVLTPADSPSGFDHAWCYFGTGPQSWLAAYTAALVFNPMVDADPAGFRKRACPCPHVPDPCPGCGKPWREHPHTTDGVRAAFPEDHP